MLMVHLKVRYGIHDVIYGREVPDGEQQRHSCNRDRAAHANKNTDDASQIGAGDDASKVTYGRQVPL